MAGNQTGQFPIATCNTRIVGKGGGGLQRWDRSERGEWHCSIVKKGMTCMETENWRYANSRTKSSSKLFLSLNGPDSAVVSAESFRLDILTQHRSNYCSHFLLHAMQNDWLHVHVLLVDYFIQSQFKEHWFLELENYNCSLSNIGETLLLIKK